MNLFDVILVSSFGQLDALSAELAQNGLQVLHIDVTEQLGFWPLEDREGPFGSFRSEKPSGCWGEVLNHGDLEVESDEGLVIWTLRGPVSLRGPLSQHQIQTRGWALPPQPSSKFRPFEELILPWMARSLFNTRFLNWSEASLNGPQLSLTSPYSVRYPTRTGLEKRIEWLKSKGVTYWRDVEMIDVIARTREGTSGLELKGSYNGVVKGYSLVWGLTSLETDHISFRMRERIFGSDLRRPLWSWLRFRFQITPLESTSFASTSQWPQSFIILDEEGGPWTHTDLMILHRTVLPDQFDLWLRLPDSKRFHQAYIRNIEKEIVDVLQSRLNTLKIELIHEPQEASYTSKELGPRPFCQYPEEMKLRPFQKNHVYFDSPEVWEHFDSEQLVQNQKRIFENLMLEWRKRMSQAAENKADNLSSKIKGADAP